MEAHRYFYTHPHTLTHAVFSFLIEKGFFTNCTYARDVWQGSTRKDFVSLHPTRKVTPMEESELDIPNSNSVSTGCRQSAEVAKKNLKESFRACSALEMAGGMSPFKMQEAREQSVVRIQLILESRIREARNMRRASFNVRNPRKEVQLDTSLS